MRLLIVEASYPEDFYSERLDGQMMERLTKLLHIESRLVYAMDRKHLAKAIALAKQDDYDVVHLSCHGADAGIAVTDRTNIDWPEFVQLFKARRYSPRALVMSTCCGATSGLAQEFEKKGARPEIIFGSTDERDFNEYAVAWTILYDRFRRDGVERNVAQDALRDISAVVHPSFRYLRWDDERGAYRPYPGKEQRFVVTEVSK
jgi:hypothetical protein